MTEIGAETQATSDVAVERWRGQMPLFDRLVPMNNCSQGPLTGRTRRAMDEYMASWRERGMDWYGWLEEVESAKDRFAALIGAEREEVAVTSSVSMAANSVASSLDFDSGRSRIAVSEIEFPSVAQVWRAQRRAGAEIDRIPLTNGKIDPASYGEAVDEETLLVSAAHAYYRTGYTQDLGAVAERVHESGALLFVDAYQSVGTRPIDVKEADVDFLAAGCLKFLLGMSGIAFLYVAPRLLERLEPRVTGWFGRSDPFAFDPDTVDWSPTAARFEVGTPPIPNAYVARAGMDIILEVGPENVRERTLRLADELIRGGRARGLEVAGPGDAVRHNPTVAFRCPGGDAHAVEDELREHGILGSARGSVLRLAPHFYSTLEDVERSLDALAASLSGTS